jgi:hypothetical protein
MVKPLTSAALTALVIVCVIVVLILLIFLLSGSQDLLTEMLNSTAKGELFGVAFTAGGPFGMWFIIFFLFLLYTKSYTKRHAPLGSIKLLLNFQDINSQKTPPSQTDHFHNVKCWYSVFSNGQKVVNDKKERVQIDRDAGPYIYVQAPRIENPEFEVRLEYRDQRWFSDTYSPKKGWVYLR